MNHGFFYLFLSDLKANTGRVGFFWALKSLLLEPSVSTAFAFRLAQFLHSKNLTGLSKIVWRINVLSSGCYLSARSKVGPGLMLPHPIGIVIGEGAVLGSNVVLYQSVTIGRDVRTGAYPEIGSGVICYPGAIIFGGIRIGNGAWIGAGCTVSMDVPPNGTVVPSVPPLINN